MKRLFPLLLLSVLLWVVFSAGVAVFKARGLVPQLPILNSNSALQAKLKLDSWIPLDQVSPESRDAILVSEDDDFFQNKGYEFKSIEDAFETDLVHLRYKRGASTITQQVVKNVFLSKKKSLQRKIEEILLAQEVEKMIPKDRILEVYFNIAQWGNGLYGIRKAAAFYFHCTPPQLGPKEGAFLAALLPNPIRYSKSFENHKLTPYLDKTIASILKRMDREGKLAPGRLEKEMAEPLPFETVVSGLTAK